MKEQTRKLVIRLISALIETFDFYLAENRKTNEEFESDFEVFATYSLNEQLKTYYNVINTK